MDWGFGGQFDGIPEPYAANTIRWVLEEGMVSILFQQLILNKEFKEEFVQRFATHLNLTFNHPRVEHIIDSMVLRISPVMPRQIERWGAIQSMEYWQNQLARLYEFAQERPHFVFRNLTETLELDETTELVVEVPDSEVGWITIHDVIVPTPYYSGSWFKSIPVRIRAHAKPGWRFVRWEGDHPSESDKLSLTLKSIIILPLISRAMMMCMNLRFPLRVF